MPSIQDEKLLPIDTKFVFPEEQTIERNKLLTHISKLTRNYLVAFQFNPTQFEGLRTNVLRLTITKKDCCDEGDQILTVFLQPYTSVEEDEKREEEKADNTTNILHICTTTITNNNQTCFTSPVRLDTWTYIRVSQRSEVANLYKYEVAANGVVIGAEEIKNGDLSEFENVKVYVSDNLYTNAKGKIRDLKIDSDLKGWYN